MIRSVSTGDLGLDVLLGGGFRLVKRLLELESATVVVRGGAGAGKTLVALQVAVELAKELGGDVAVGCVEILPSEYVAQVVSARPDLEGRVIMLASTPVVIPPGGRGATRLPRVVCGLLTDLDPATPDLVGSLEGLGRDVTAAGGEPRVFLVDSLIEGYGLGASTPRIGADAVMKFAAQGGYGLVLCEETHGAGASPWIFAADTVLELGVEPRERGRWIEVRKHRFGASVSGRHEIDLGGEEQPKVFPEPHAWVARDLGEILPRQGWTYRDRAGIPALVWDAQLAPDQPTDPLPNVGFVVIASPATGVARSLAYGLRPAAAAWHRPRGEASVLLIELDPLALREDLSREEHRQVCRLPTVHGPARALRMLIEQLARSFDPEHPSPSVARVVMGDLRTVLASADALAWVEVVRVFVSLIIASRWGIPVIAHMSGPENLSGETSTALLSTYADLTITAPHRHQAHATQRGRRDTTVLNWTREVTSVPLTLDHLPGASGRSR